MGKIIRLTERELTSIIKRMVSEVSADTFKSAVNLSKERGTDKRTTKLGKLYYDKFIGKPLMGGEITDINVSKPSQGDYFIVTIKYEKENDGERAIKYIEYDVDNDEFNINRQIKRSDARVLSLIAKHINPDTKYEKTGQHFSIKGWQ